MPRLSRRYYCTFQGFGLNPGEIGTVVREVAAGRIEAKNFKMPLVAEGGSFPGPPGECNLAIHGDTNKIEVIMYWATPSCLKKVRSFLWLCSYYRKFVLDFSSVVAP